MRRLISLTAWLTAAALAAPHAGAELPLARLFSVFPPGGQQGTQTEVALHGVDLDETTKLHFSHPGLTATLRTNESPTSVTEPGRFVVSIGSNVPPGVYDVRAVGRFGISNPRAFVVGTLPELTESSSHNAFTTAMDISVGATINGRTEAGQSDYFRFTARQGQRLLVECAAREIDSRMDPVLILYDEQRRELRWARQTGLIDFIIPADGTYVLRVHDFLNQGGAEQFYRLSVSTAPRVDVVLPAAGQPGAKSRFRLAGRNLPGGQPTKLRSADGQPLDELVVEVELPGDTVTSQRLMTSKLLRPAAAVLDGLDYVFGAAAATANPVLLTFAAAPVVLEQEPIDRPTEAQKLSLPCEVTGRFYPSGDRDWFTFEARKGEVFWIEVFSERLGLPTDPLVVVQRLTKADTGEEKAIDVLELSDNDTNLGGQEFKTTTRDPVGRFEVKDDGAYRVQVRDLFNVSANDPSLVYRLAIRRESPDFRLVALPQPPPLTNKDSKEILLWTPVLRRGGVAPLKVLAFRRDGFTGAIQLEVPNLPKGVAALPAQIDAGANATTLWLTASEDANGWAGSIAVIGKATINGAPVVREARGGTVTWPVGDHGSQPVFSRLAREVVLAVSDAETEPLLVKAAEDKTWETCVAGRLQIPLKLFRRAEFNGNTKLKVAGLGPLEDTKEIEVDARASTATLELDLSQQKLGVGDYSFRLESQPSFKYSRNPDAIKTAEETLKLAEKNAADLGQAVKQAGEAKQAAAKAFEEAAAAAKQAEQTLAEIKAKTDTTSEAKAAAENAAAQATAKAKEASAHLAAAEKTEAEAIAKAKEAGAQRDATKRRVEELARKDVTATFYSLPISLKVTPAPVTFASVPATSQVFQGMLIAVPVKLNRLYGFADPVDLSLAIPGEVKGLSAQKLTVAKDHNEGRLIVETTPDTPPGEHKLTLQAALNLNGQDLKLEQPITVKVLAVDPAKK